MTHTYNLRERKPETVSIKDPKETQKKQFRLFLTKYRYIDFHYRGSLFGADHINFAPVLQNVCNDKITGEALLRLTLRNRKVTETIMHRQNLS